MAVHYSSRSFPVTLQAVLHTVDKKPRINRRTNRTTRDFREMTLLLRGNTIKLLLRSNQMKLTEIQTKSVDAATPIFRYLQSH
jgi:hypothetical protein